MAAAYAALVSVMQIIHQLEHHPSPPISIDKQQLQSLTEIVTSLQEFLERYKSPFADSNEADPLEMRIADAAYAAEDVIESYIVDTIKLGDQEADTIKKIKCRSCWFCWAEQYRGDKKIDFYQDLQKVIEEMDLVKKEAMEITTEKAAVVQDLQQLRESNVSPASVGFYGQNNTVVGFDKVSLEIMDKLTAGRLDRQVIPIVGMGGIGKTTLARNVYAQPLVKERFDICAWVTISQEFNTKEILCEALSQAKKESREQLKGMSEDELQLAVYQYLSGRRFLIVMDDMWSIDSWNKIERFFPDNNNGSRIVVTTRLSTLGSQLDNNSGIEMKFLDEDSSRALFSKTVFGEESFPREVEEIGKKIVKSCGGLPLSIVVIGGLLKRLEHTQECWESIWKNLNSVVNSESDEYCLKVLKMSYNHLPAHLKPCFLYMGVFEEDCEIHVPTLLRLWVSEGFLKPQSGTSLETTAKEYLKDLVGRNLVLVHELRYTGSIKSCKIHDLLRELCLREAQKEKFYSERRIVIPGNTSTEKVLDALQSLSHARSLICDQTKVRLRPNCGLLRSLHALDYKFRYEGGSDDNPLHDVFQLVNLRYLSIRVCRDSNFPSSINLLWNLHTLIVCSELTEVNAPAEIWKMSQLRHVNFFEGLRLPDPPSGNNDIVIMENLQTLAMVWNFKCSEEVVKRIPNIKKLSIIIDGSGVRSNDDDDYCLNNLESLRKLESFRCWNDSGSDDFLHNLTFPQSLKKLTLSSNFDCENMLEKIGSLPLLRKLVLMGDGFFKTCKWETVEGGFCSLKFLSLLLCSNLERWETTEWSHFPRLEHLVLSGLELLEDIPSVIGEIPTLKSIELRCCSISAVKSLKKIVKEQEELQGEELPFHVEHLVLNGLELLEEIHSVIGEIPTLKSIELEYCIISAVKSLKKIVEEQEELQGEELPFHVRVGKY